MTCTATAKTNDGILPVWICLSVTDGNSPHNEDITI